MIKNQAERLFAWWELQFGQSKEELSFALGVNYRSMLHWRKSGIPQKYHIKIEKLTNQEVVFSTN